MTNPKPKPEPAPTVAPTPPPPPDLTLQLTVAYDEGYNRARRDVLHVLLQPSDNMGSSFAEALYWAGRDKDGIFWLSVECRDRATPTHQLNNISKMFRNNRKLSISAIAPYRVSNIR